MKKISESHHQINNVDILASSTHDQNQNWYKQLVITIVAFICLITNTICSIMLGSKKIVDYWIMIVGFIESFLFLLFALFKFILRFLKIQRCFKRFKCVQKIMKLFYKEFDSETTLISIPNIEKVIEKYCIHPIDETKQNISPIKQMEMKWKMFSEQYSKGLKLLSLIFGIISLILSVGLFFLYFQSKVSFPTFYSQIAIYSIVSIINLYLLGLLVYKILTFVFFFLYEASYLLLLGKGKKRLFISIFILSLITGNFTLMNSILENKTLGLIISFIAFCLICSFIIYTVYLIGYVVYFYIKQNYSLKTFISDSCSYLKNHYLIIIPFIGIFFISSLLFLLTGWNIHLSFKHQAKPIINSFDTINETSTKTPPTYSFCSTEQKISQLTFGIGNSYYYRQEYAKPSIITPTINMSNLFDVSASTHDYYRITSETIPMNGIVYYPTNIKNSNTSKNVVFILHNEMGNLIDSDNGYVYLQESLAENGIVSISLDQGFLDLDEKGNKIKPKDPTKDVNEVYLQARVSLTIQTINYLCKRLNTHFSNKLNFTNIGLIGDREGGGVAMRIINTLKSQQSNDQMKNNSTNLLSNITLNQFSIESIFIMNCKDIPIPNPMVGMDSYFIETLPELSSYDPPLLSSYYMYNKTDRDDTLTYKYSGLLIIERGIGDYYNMKYNQAKSDILMDYIVQKQSYLIPEQDLRCLVTNYATSHFLCSLNKNYTNLDLLKDFKRGKDIIPNESGYVNTFESNHEKLLYSNGTIYDMDISVVPNTYEGKLYQNLYQTLHLLYVCQQEEKCAITFKLSKPVNCSAIKFSFFKNTDSDEKIYDQYITVFTQQNTSFNLPSFTYAKINDIINKGSISEMYLLQTYYFTFPQPDQLITHFILYFEGEILLDDIVLVF